MAQNQQLLLMDNTPILSQKLDYLTDTLYQSRFDPNPFYKKPPKPSAPAADVAPLS